MTCRPPERGVRIVTEPVLIVEALSPSTAAQDRGIKLPDYRRIASARQILLISSTDRHIECWLRAEDGWKIQDLLGDAAIPLTLDAHPLPLAAVYDGVAL